MQKLYSVIDKHNNASLHDYDIVMEETKDNGTLYSLYRSNGSHWSEQARGEKIISILDHGNGYTFPKWTKDLDYGYARDIFVLMTFINSQSIIYKGDILESKKIASI